MKIITPDDEVIELGTTESTPTIGITDYSRRETDEFGVTTVVPRSFSRRLSLRFALPFAEVDGVQKRLADMRATPVKWIAGEALSWLQVEGFYKDFSIDLNVPPLSFCTVTVEGLAEAETVPDAGGDPAPSGNQSTLRLVRPATIAGNVLAASNVPENDHPEWNANTPYAIGARVMVAVMHRVYESVSGGNLGHDPVLGGGHWIEVGPTNRWAMFDEALGTSTTRAGSVQVTLNPVAVDAVALLDVSADTVRVQVPGYDRTLAVPASGTVLFLDVPQTSGAGNMTVTVTGAEVSIGTMMMGELVTLGQTEASPTAEITDYSRKDVDDFGEVTIVQRAWAKRMTAKALIRTDAVDLVANRIASVRTRPSLWIGDAGLDSLTIYGFFRDFGIEVGENVSKLSLSIEGLSKAAPIPQAEPPEAGVVSWPDIVGPNKPDDNADVTSDNVAAAVVGQGSGATANSLDDLDPAAASALASTMGAVTAIGDDNVISSAEKWALIEVHRQYSALYVSAHNGSTSLNTSYGDDPTQAQRVAATTALNALNAYLVTLAPAWSEPAQNTPVNGGVLRGHFEALANALAALMAANTAISAQRARVDGKIFDIGTGNFLSREGLITALGISAGFTGQGALATRSTVDDNYIAGALGIRIAPHPLNANYLTASTIAYPGGAGLDALQPQEAGSNKTETRTASAIAGQGPGATAAANDVLNSRTENGIVNIARPGGATFQLNGNPTGAIRIVLPASLSTENNMVKMTVDIFEYDVGKTQTYEIAGYIYGVGGYWVNCTAKLIGGGGAARPVYFDKQGAYWIVRIGDTSGNWQYPGVSVRNVQVSYGVHGSTEAYFKSGWAIDLVTTPPVNLSGSVTQPTAGDTVFGLNAYEVWGGPLATKANFKTAEGVSAGIAGQSTWATYNGDQPSKLEGVVPGADRAVTVEPWASGVVKGNTLSNNTGSTGYHAAAYGARVKGASFVAAKIIGGDYTMVNLDADLYDTPYSAMNAALHYHAPTGAWGAYVNGSYVAAGNITPGYYVGEDLSIIYDESFYRFFIGGYELPNCPAPAGLTLFPVWHAYNNGTTITGLKSGPARSAARIGHNTFDDSGNLKDGSDLITSQGISSGFSGQGALATRNSVAYGDGYTFGFGTFAALSQINAGNISSYIANLAIGGALIANAAIGTAHIDALAVTTAHIQNLSVDTIKIANGAVSNSVAVKSSSIAALTPTAGQPNQTYSASNVVSASLTANGTGQVQVVVAGQVTFSPLHFSGAVASASGLTVYIKRIQNGVETLVDQVTVNGPPNSAYHAGALTLVGLDTPAAGPVTYRVDISTYGGGTSTSTWTWSMPYPKIIATELKK